MAVSYSNGGGGRFDNILQRGVWDGDKRTAGSTAHAAFKWTLELLRPAIFTRNAPRKQPRRLAYLDGLRGFAAFLVYWQHHELWPLRNVNTGRILEAGWGAQGKYYFATFPVVRTFFTGGHFAVAVFFVISAYVLSVKPLTLIHAGDYEALSSNLGSALFRRWIRLHLPIIMVTFAYMTSWHLFGVWTLSPEHKATWGEEAWNWYCEFKNFSFAFRTGGVAWFTYNFPVWSIPVEFRGSIVVYTSLLAVSRATRNGRLWCYIGLMFYFFFIVDGWFAAIFVSGMMMCDLDLLAQKDQLPSFFNIVKRRKTLIYYGLFVFSLLLSGVPTHIADVQILQEAPFWRHMTWLKPEAAWDHKWIFLFISANCLVASIPRISWLKGFFETTFNQYLGRISFSLYLVHGPILWTLGDRLYAAAGWYKEGHEINIPQWIDTFPLPKWGPLGLEPCFLLPHIIILPFTLWMAEIVTKLVDEPSVRFANWFYRVTLPSTGSKVDEARLG